MIDRASENVAKIRLNEHDMAISAIRRYQAEFAKLSRPERMLFRLVIACWNLRYRFSGWRRKDMKSRQQKRWARLLAKARAKKCIALRAEREYRQLLRKGTR